jgi:hypothetical protein
VPPAIGEQGERGRLQHADRALDPVAAAMAPGAPGAVDQLVGLDAHRVLELERLDRRVERVAHPDVHPRRPGPAGIGALAAADRLVVRPVGAADDHVVHRPLALRGEAVHELRQRGEHGVRHALARLHVARDDGRRPAGVDERALLHADVERRERARVGRHVGRQQHAQREQAGRAGDRDRAVHVPGDRPGGAVEVDRERVAVERDGHADRDVVVRHAVALDLALRGRAAVRKPAQRLARAPLGVGDHLGEDGGDRVPAAPLDELRQALLGQPVRRDLRAQVAAADVRRAHVGEDQVEHVGHVRPAAHEPHGRDHEALLEELVRAGGHRARAHAADVGVVRAGHGVAEHVAAGGHRRDERDVGQVGAAGERVVDGEDVARLGVAGDHGRDRLGHGPEMDRDVLGLRDHLPVGVEQGGRAVAPLLDVGGVGAADQHGAHLLGDPRQGAGEDRQGDGIDQEELRESSGPRSDRGARHPCRARTSTSVPAPSTRPRQPGRT